MNREDKDSSSRSAVNDCIQAFLWTDGENQAKNTVRAAAR